MRSDFQYTWTKSLKNPNSSILKKLERIMINEVFMHKYQKAFGVFLPFLISDHSPAIVTIHEGPVSKRRAFRFTYYIADKDRVSGLCQKRMGGGCVWV